MLGLESLVSREVDRPGIYWSEASRLDPRVSWIWRGKYIVIDNNTVTAGYVYTKAMGGFSINNVLDLATLRKKPLCGR